jgi:hypothetical protein
MDIPRDMLDAMNVDTVVAKSMLQGDYANKTVKIEIPNEESVTLGNLRARNLTLHTGPNTQHVDFANVQFTQGDDAPVRYLRILPNSNGPITLDSPLSGAFARVTIASPHDVTITGENNSLEFAEHIMASKLCFKGTCYEDIIQL